MASKRRNAILWGIIAILLVIIFMQMYYPHQPQRQVPALGNVGTERFNANDSKNAAKPGKIGASIPASLIVQEDGKTIIRIKNTGSEAFVASCIADGKEIYRSSRFLQPNEHVDAVIQPPAKATKVDTMVETEGGGKFSITSELVR